MRRSRRNGHAGMEFGGSGEDSFVAVVVTKLTGALLFILLLTMVIMALLPKAVDLPSSGKPDGAEPKDLVPLAITTPEMLPEAIAGHPYTVALAANGGRGPLRWTLEGTLPKGLSFDSGSARLRGTPQAGTPTPVSLMLRVSDGTESVQQVARLVVYQSDRPLATPAWWKPGLPPVSWLDWLEQGFGFLVLWLVYLVGMSTLASLQRWSLAAIPDSQDCEGELQRVRDRFFVYRTLTRVVTFGASITLALWLWLHRNPS